MIVSRSHKFIYCRIPKTASTSLSEALEPYIDGVERYGLSRAVNKLSFRKINGPLFPFRNHSHLTMEGARANLKKNFFNRAFKFSVCRHPEDWIVSYYNHVLRENFPSRYAMGFEDVRKRASFDFFLDWLSERGPRPQCSMLLGTDGQFLVDEVLQVENLEEGVRDLSLKLNVTIKIERRNVGDYNKSRLSDSQLSKIESLFALDYAVFGYSSDNAIGKPRLVASDATREVVRSIGPENLARFDVWKPYD